VELKCGNAVDWNRFPASASTSSTNREAQMTVLGVVGGSGVYDIAGLQRATWQKVTSSFGEPSDDFLFGTLDDLPVVFVPRHGRGHRHSPSSINYRANIDAL
jgi:5'-methylthioadenosine phosphorylase